VIALEADQVDAPLFYFVRHGETDWNAQHRLQGTRDVPLNDRGRVQAARCGVTLRDLIASRGRAAADFAFVSSPLSRAAETMAIVRGALGLQAAGCVLDSRLAEMSFGRWEGLTYREVGTTDAPLLRLRERDRWNFRPPGGESYADILVRVAAWRAGVTGDTVVTAHGGVARAVMVLFGVRTPAEAPKGVIEQGVVFQFAPGAMTKHR
jgi:probable phosphoglycerate mutase